MDYLHCSLLSYWLLLTCAWACVCMCLSVICAGMYTEGLCFNAGHSSSSPALRNSVEFYFFCRDTKMHRKHIFLKSSSVVILLRQIFVEKWYPSISSQISNKLLIGFLSFCLVWLPAPIFMHY